MKASGVISPLDSTKSVIKQHSAVESWVRHRSISHAETRSSFHPSYLFFPHGTCSTCLDYLLLRVGSISAADSNKYRKHVLNYFFLRILAGRSAYRCPRCTRIFTWQETPCDPLVELPPCRLRDWWSTHRVLDARWIVGARAWGLFGAIGGFGFWLLWRFWVRWDSQVAT